MKIESVGQISIAVSDILRSMEFYKEKLGLTFLFEAGTNFVSFYIWTATFKVSMYGQSS
jgi:catechol 2,3-dioxygenase-like lactoylglutathione lyase family enzyme